MFESPFSHGSIRKLVVGFGTLFSQVKLQRKNDQGVVTQTVAVPIAYGPKEKWYVKTDQDPELENRVYTTLPRMGFEITSYSYDPARMVNRNATVRSFSSANNNSVHAAVPYNMDISLYAITKGTEDGLDIVEQILPLFAPEYNLNVNMIPEMGIVHDIPIILNGVTVQDDYEGDFQTRRFVTHTFTFTAKMNLYGNTNLGKIITTTTAHVDTATLGFGENTNTAIGNPSTGSISDSWVFK